jgi:hypothetical protein
VPQDDGAGVLAVAGLDVVRLGLGGDRQRGTAVRGTTPAAARGGEVDGRGDAEAARQARV